jgi:hypothetical protein
MDKIIVSLSSLLDFIFTNIIRVSDLFAQMGFEFQILQSSFFVCLSNDSRWKLFFASNCPRPGERRDDAVLPEPI